MLLAVNVIVEVPALKVKFVVVKLKTVPPLIIVTALDPKLIVLTLLLLVR